MTLLIHLLMRLTTLFERGQVLEPPLSDADDEAEGESNE